MLLSRKAAPALVMLLASVALAATAKADSFSFTGAFNQDDNVRLYEFDLSAPSTVTLLTWSYGGGMNAAGENIPSGGFAPIISLFSGSGSLLDFTVTGSCPPQTRDPLTRECLDVFLQKINLGAGEYFVALTEFFNIPNGPSLSNGFFEDGQGNFTGPQLCGRDGAFLDDFCNQRNGNFALDIRGVNGASEVPEPATLCLLGSGLVGLAGSLGRRRKATAVQNQIHRSGL